MAMDPNPELDYNRIKISAAHLVDCSHNKVYYHTPQKFMEIRLQLLLTDTYTI